MSLLLSDLLERLLGLVSQFATLRHVLFLEAIRVGLVTTEEEDFMLPVSLEFVDQILDLESDSGLDLSISALSEHAL